MESHIPPYLCVLVSAGLKYTYTIQMNAVAHISQLSKLADGDPRTYHGSRLLQSLLIASPTLKVETTLGIARRLR